MFKKLAEHAILFRLGIIGFIFYVIEPIIFPGIPSHPEVLPVLTLMMGLGIQARKGKKNDNGPPDSE